ncbi:hypothetical protein DTO166G5_6681 [Paecilomyces variotii]|nr:hypothetical protein DTO166G5_6681 [Paecilomyces variotii]KAJ9374523.1 hypothetical protein DTO282E5_606 [Paecilomyces variotii]
MAPSVSIGSDFVILLIAIIFHQTFEGLALGSHIAAVKWRSEKLQPWFMALAYGCTIRFVRSRRKKTPQPDEATSPSGGLSPIPPCPLEDTAAVAETQPGPAAVVMPDPVPLTAAETPGTLAAAETPERLPPRVAIMKSVLSWLVS